MEKQTLTVLEATKLLGVSRNLGYELPRTGKLPVIRPGRRLLVPKVALDKMLEATGQPNLPVLNELARPRAPPGQPLRHP